MFLHPIKNIYYVFYQDERTGKRNKISTKCKLKSDAFKYLTNFKKELDKRNSTLHDITLKDLIKSFLELVDATRTKSTYKCYCSLLNTFFKSFNENILVKTLKTEDIEKVIFQIKKKNKPHSVNSSIAIINLIINYAKEKKYLSKDFNLMEINIKIQEELPLYFTKEQFLTFISVIDDKDFRDLVFAAVLTGCRKGELINLTWDNVSLDKRYFVLTKTKTNKIRQIPINRELYEIFINRLNNTHCFMNKNNQWENTLLHRLFKKYLKIAGLDSKLHFHSLRHTTASWLAMNGVSLYQIQNLLGHSTPQMTQRYSHLTDFNQMENAERLSHIINSKPELKPENIPVHSN